MADEVYEGAIGIDLGKFPLSQLLRLMLIAQIGTTYSCVANYEGTNVEISTLNTVVGGAGTNMLPHSCK